jgi:peptidoglycan hydrolase CwlO-like protein
MSQLSTEERDNIESEINDARAELRNLYDAMNTGDYAANSMSTDMNYAINEIEKLENKIARLKRKLEGKSEGCTMSGGRRRRYKNKRSTKRRKSTKRRTRRS